MGSNAAVYHDSFPSRDAIMSDLLAALPVADLVAWLIFSYPSLPTRCMLDIVQLVKSADDLVAEFGGRKEYETATHCVTGRVISIRRVSENAE